VRIDVFALLAKLGMATLLLNGDRAICQRRMVSTRDLARCSSRLVKTRSHIVELPSGYLPSVHGVSRVARILLKDEHDLRKADVKDSTVLLRVDFNVPLRNGEVWDWTRVDAVMPTIRLLQGKGARIVIASHFGKPDPRHESMEDMKAYSSLEMFCDRLREALGMSFVGMAPLAVGPETTEAIAALLPGEVIH
jgi:hypothetical protein